MGTAFLYLSAITGPLPEFYRYSLGFLVAATAAYMLMIAVVSTPQANCFVKHRWVFPVCCGMLLNVFTFAGLVTGLRDVVGYVIGFKSGYAVLFTSVLFWTLVATGIVKGIDRFLSRNHNKGVERTR